MSKPVVVITQVADAEADEEGAIAFQVKGTLDGSPFEFVVAMTAEEGGTWDVLEGEIPGDDDSIVMGEVFQHPAVTAAIARELA